MADDITSFWSVQVTANRSKANGNAIPLTFGVIIGMPTDYSKNEPYGSPSGFIVNVTPGSAIQISIPLSSQNVANNSGALTGGSGDTYANGNSAGSYDNVSDDQANPSLNAGTLSTAGTEHGISNIIAPTNCVVGVFMDKNGAT